MINIEMKAKELGVEVSELIEEIEKGNEDIREFETKSDATLYILQDNGIKWLFDTYSWDNYLHVDFEDICDASGFEHNNKFYIVRDSIEFSLSDNEKQQL